MRFRGRFENAFIITSALLGIGGFFISSTLILNDTTMIFDGESRGMITDESARDLKDEYGGESAYLTMYGAHRVQPAMAKLPKWLRDYFLWNQNQVQNANSETKYLVVTCLQNDRCGGLSDRLRSLPFMLLVASKVNRVLCIYWSKPFGLDNLLLPPSGGVDWRCPASFDAIVDKNRSSAHQQRFKHYLMYAQKYRKNGEEGKQVAELIIEDIRKNDDVYTGISFVTQDFVKINKANNVFNAISYNDAMPSADKWYHIDLMEHIFRIMFEPVEPIKKNINATMTRLGMVEGNYTSVHVRARYPTNRIKKVIGTSKAKHHDQGAYDHPFEGEYKDILYSIAKNALKCGMLLNQDQDRQLFFSSDNFDLKEYMVHNPFTFGDDKKVDIPTRKVHPVGAGLGEQRKEFKHLESNQHGANSDPFEFYNIIEDLLIMGGSACVSHGIGSFGAFGAGLMGNKCRVVHRDYAGRMNKCPNLNQFKFIHNITKDDLIVGHGTSDRDERLHTDGYFWEDLSKIELCSGIGCNLTHVARSFKYVQRS